MLKLKKSFAKKLGLLKKSRFLPRNVRQDLYFKVILPSLTYGLILYFRGSVLWNAVTNNCSALTKNIPYRDLRLKLKSQANFNELASS